MDDFLCKRCEHYLACDDASCLKASCTMFFELVRCKDCKHYVPFIDPYNKAGMCNRKMLGLIAENGFCSYGERRTGD